MKAPKKVITAMAMAALLGGVAAPAFADGDFKASTGNTVAGQKPLQETEKIQEDINVDPDTSILTSKGDIEVTGNFIKTINNFPTATEEGRYLRVTMPLTLDYTYNLDNGVMKSAEGTITNESVIAKTSETTGEIVEIGQPVKMSFIDLLGKSEKENMEYVTVTTTDKQKVQLPFELVITTNAGDKVKNVSLAQMKEGHYTDTIEIQPGTDLNIKIGKITGQDITNSDLITEESVSIAHNMKLQFEYAGE